MNRFGESVRLRGQEPSTKSNEQTWGRETAFGIDLKPVQMWLGHITSRTFRTTRGVPQGAPERPLVFTMHHSDGHCALSTEKNNGSNKRERTRLPCGRVVLPNRGICREHRDDGNITKSLRKHGSDLAEGFKDLPLELGHAKTNWTRHTHYKTHG